MAWSHNLSISLHIKTICIFGSLSSLKCWTLLEQSLSWHWTLFGALYYYISYNLDFVEAIIVLGLDFV